MADCFDRMVYGFTLSSLSPNLDQILVDIYRSAIIALIAWGFYVLAAGESILYGNSKKFKIDDILIAFLSRY